MNATPNKRTEPTQPTDPAEDFESLSFEQAMQQLEEIVAELQRNDLPLERGIERYEQGLRYAKRCHQTLRRAARRIELLSGVGPEGEAETTTFDDQGGGEDLNEKAARRSARRTASPKPVKSREIPPVQGKSEGLFE